MDKNMGIYKIANGMNLTEYYLGSAVKFSDRFPRHRSDLKKHIHHNYHLQELYNKYGLDNLIFEVIEYVQDKKDLIAREQHYIDTLNPSYNIRKIADSNLGLNWSVETKLKMSEAKKNMSVETKHKISESHRGKKLSEATKLKQSEALKGNKSPMYGKHRTEETKLKISEANSKPFKLLSPQGIIFKGTNLKRFCKENNLNVGHMCDVLNNKRKSHKGWTKASDL